MDRVVLPRSESADIAPNRGTGETLPVSCFNDTAVRTYLTSVRPMVSDISDATVGQVWALQGALAKSCAINIADIGTLLGTAYVARDLMHIVDALGEDGLLRYWGTSILWAPNGEY
jgi:hypothetical protein